MLRLSRFSPVYWHTCARSLSLSLETQPLILFKTWPLIFLLCSSKQHFNTFIKHKMNSCWIYTKVQILLISAFHMSIMYIYCMCVHTHIHIYMYLKFKFHLKLASKQTAVFTLWSNYTCLVVWILLFIHFLYTAYSFCSIFKFWSALRCEITKFK